MSRTLISDCWPRSLLRTQRRPNLSEKRFDVDWLAEHLSTPGSERITGHFRSGERADRKDWCLREIIPLANLARGFHAVQGRQRQIHQNQIRFYSSCLPQALLAIAGLNYFVAFGSQQR